MIKRNFYNNLLKQALKNNKIKILEGARRVGKTSLLLYFQEYLILNKNEQASNFLFIDFENFIQEFQKDKDSILSFFNIFISKDENIKYIFLNEPQNIKNYEELILEIYTKHKEKIQLYISSSISNLFSINFIEENSYNLEYIKISSFSFKEIYENSNSKNKDELLNEYIKFGGYPFIYANKLDKFASNAYMKDLIHSSIYIDIIRRNSLRDSLTCSNVIFKLLENISNEFSSKMISKYLKEVENKTLSNETLYNYFQYAKNAFIIDSVPKLNILKNKKLQYQEKIYANDIGLCSLFSPKFQFKEEKVYENLAFIELKKLGFEIYTGKIQEEEINIIAVKKNKKLYFQFVNNLTEENKRKIYNIYSKIKDNYPKYVVGRSKKEDLENGILYINIIDLILNIEEL